jgi:hypothetical protein
LDEFLVIWKGSQMESCEVKNLGFHRAVDLLVTIAAGLAATALIITNVRILTRLIQRKQKEVSA